MEKLFKCGNVEVLYLNKYRDVRIKRMNNFSCFVINYFNFLNKFKNKWDKHEYMATTSYIMSPWEFTPLHLNQIILRINMANIFDFLLVMAQDMIFVVLM